MDDVIDQMKQIQSRIGSSISNSNKSATYEKTEIVGGEGINVSSDKGKVSISTIQQEAQPSQPALVLPSGNGVLGINNGVLFVYETVDCEN
jgi:hypothetical protein